MMIKFHKAGASGGDAADYLEGEKDHKGRSRENVEVLRGDPFRVGQIADSLELQTPADCRRHCLGAGGQPDSLSRLTKCWTTLNAWPGLDWNPTVMPGPRSGMTNRAVVSTYIS